MSIVFYVLCPPSLRSAQLLRSLEFILFLISSVLLVIVLKPRCLFCAVLKIADKPKDSTRQLYVFCNRSKTKRNRNRHFIRWMKNIMERSEVHEQNLEVLTY